MARRSRSLTWRLTATTLGFVAVVWAITIVVAWFVTRHELSELLDAHLAQTAALLATGQVIDDGMAQAPILIRRYQSRVAFQIWREGRLVARSADAPDGALAASSSAGLSDELNRGTWWRVFTTVRQGEGGVQDVIHVGEQLSARRHVLLASLRGTSLPLLLALPLMAVGIGWAVRRAMQPLRALGDAVAARQPRMLTALPEAEVVLEARPLVDALNDLFARVSTQLASERRFTADAAHELRTPIAAIRMQAQVAQGAATEPERAQALAATVAGCDRATHLVEQLLQMARLEADVADDGAGTQASAGSDLGAVTDDLVHALLPIAHARGQAIEWQRPDAAVPVPTSATFVTVLLRNLLDNALRYSPPGARVRVQLRVPSVGAGPRIEVEDSGPGLADEALAQLGERFFRVLGTGQSGSGLGWSIVRRVARLHALRTEVDRSSALGGLRVRVSWPRQAPVTSQADGRTRAAPR